MILEIEFMTEWYMYVISFIIAFIGRSADVLSTRYVSRKMDLETNSSMKRLYEKAGWKGIWIMDILCSFLCAVHIYLALMMFIVSIIVAGSNLNCLIPKTIGEEEYLNLTKQCVKQTTLKNIILTQSSSIFTLVMPGLLLLFFLIVLNDFTAVFFIATAMIVLGVFIPSLRIQFLINLKNEQSEKEKELKETK